MDNLMKLLELLNILSIDIRKIIQSLNRLKTNVTELENDITNTPVNPNSSPSGMPSDSISNQSKVYLPETGIKHMALTQSEYDAITDKDPNTVYYIIEG